MHTSESTNDSSHSIVLDPNGFRPNENLSGCRDVQFLLPTTILRCKLYIYTEYIVITSASLLMFPWNQNCTYS